MITIAFFLLTLYWNTITYDRRAGGQKRRMSGDNRDFAFFVFERT